MPLHAWLTNAADKDLYLRIQWDLARRQCSRSLDLEKEMDVDKVSPLEVQPMEVEVGKTGSEIVLKKHRCPRHLLQLGFGNAADGSGPSCSPLCSPVPVHLMVTEQVA